MIASSGRLEDILRGRPRRRGLDSLAVQFWIRLPVPWETMAQNCGAGVGAFVGGEVVGACPSRVRWRVWC